MINCTSGKAFLFQCSCSSVFCYCVAKMSCPFLYSYHTRLLGHPVVAEMHPIDLDFFKLYFLVLVSLSVFLLFNLSVCPFVCMSNCLLVYFSAGPFVCLLICLLAHLSACLFVCLSICLQVHLSVF